MSEKRGAAEANSNEEVLQQENNAKRAKLTPQSDTVLQDLPNELLECILIKTVVMEVRSMKLAKSVWAEKADLVIDQLASVCSQWNSIITTDYFLREVHRILDNTAQEMIRFEILLQSTIQLYVWRVVTMKDELFMLCRIKHQECFINVYDCNNMLDVKDVIPLVGIHPVDMAACNVSNCLYVLRKETHCHSVLRITRNEEQQFNVFPLITDLSLSLSDVGLFVSVNGSILILSPQIIPNPSAVSVYDARGLLKREIMLSHDKLGFTGVFSVIENSNGNLVLATFCIANGFVTELKEIDTIGRLVRQYKSSISILSEFVMHCDMDDSKEEDHVTKDSFREILQDKQTLDAFITSPQQTPRFTDSYSASLYQTPEGSTEYPSPVKNHKDDSSSEPSDCRGDESLSGEDETEDDHKPNRYQNPEPPKELMEQHIVDADNIGNTVYSKCWVFATLMNLLKAVEEQNKVDKGKEEEEEEEEEEKDDDESTCRERHAAEPVELEDGLQDDLCKLWDMSMNQEVVNFLVEHNAIDLLTGVIAKSKAPRATEICVGIFGNMACSPDVCHLLGSKTELVNLVLLLLESPDAPTLVETMRLLHVCVSSERSEVWLSAIKEASIIYDQVLFIFQSSTNLDLLKYTAEFVDKLMEVEEDICSQWSNPELVVAIMEAIKQTGSHVSHILETFLHVLQLVSTSEQGVQALATYCGQVCMLILGYLKHICADEIVGVEGHENIIGSALSIFCVIFGLWEDRMHLLQKDFQLFRCTLKILDVVYPKHLHLPHAVRNSRSQSISVSVNNVLENDVDLVGNKRNFSAEDIPCVPSVAETANENPVAAGLAPAAANLHPHEGEEQQKLEEKLENVDSLEQTAYGLKGETKARDSGDENSPDMKRDEEYKVEMTNMLYEVLQAMLSELVLMLAELPVSEAKHTNGDPVEPMSEGETPAEDPNIEELPRVPMSLVYLEKCDRHRLQYMLQMLSEVSDRDYIALLYATTQKHNLKRVCRVIDSMNLRTE